MGAYDNNNNNNYIYEPPVPITDNNTRRGTLWEAQNSNTENIPYNTNPYPKPFTGINLQETTALQFAKKIVGKTIQITSENVAVNDILKKLDKNNNFLKIAYQINKLNSIFGFCVVLISVKKGEVFYSIARPFQTNYTKLFNELKDIDLYSNITSGAKNNIVQHLKVNSKTIERDFINASQDDLKNYGLEPYKKEHNLDFIPASLFNNYFNESPWNLAFKDAYPDGTNLKGLQVQMNQLFNTIHYELNANKTRIFIKLTRKEFQDLNNYGSDAILDIYQNSGIIITPNAVADGYQSGTLQNWLEVQAGSPNLQTYMQAINDLANFYFKSVGLTNNDTDTTFNSATEVKFNNSADSETIILKRNVFKDNLIDLIIKSVLLYLPNYDYDELRDIINITLKENIGIDRETQIQESVYLIDNGLSTPVLELMKINNETKENSELLYQEILKYQEKQRNLVDSDVISKEAENV